jgi:hypothetical protein
MGWFSRSAHVDEQLSAYLDGELNARQAKAVERHLVACVACSALLEDLRAAKSMLAATPRETPRRSFVLGPEYARQRFRQPRPKRSAWSFAPAAALAVLVALLVVDLGSFTSTSNKSTSSSETANAQKSTAARQATASDSSASGAAGAAAPSAPGAGGLAEPPATHEGAAPLPAQTPATTLGAQSVPSTAPSAGSSGSTSADSSGAASSAGPTAPDVFAAPAVPSEAPPNQPPNGSGFSLSTLRILEILAAVAFVSSSLYVLVRPRLKS